MIEARKEYLIKIFLKKCTIQTINKEHMEIKFRWCEETFGVPKEVSEKIKKKYTLDDYINKMIPVVDKYFSIEDLKALIQFYSSDVGKKMLDPIMLREIGIAGADMDARLEQEFALYDNKK